MVYNVFVGNTKKKEIAMYHIIANPKAGDRKVARLLKHTLKLLDKAGAEYTLHETHYKAHGTEIAAELTKEDGVNIIALGGDGTVHDVLNGIRDVEKCNFGIIPLGTGNDFAASGKIPYHVKDAVNLILKGETKPTDYLEIGGKRCMNVGGVGIDVDVLVRCNKGKRRGKLKYIRSLIVSFFKFNGYELTIECEGETFTKKTLMVAACNGKQFGGGIAVCPIAEIDDDKMDVMVVDCFESKWKILNAFLLLVRGKIMVYPHKKHFHTDKVKISSDKPFVVQLDGELYEGLAFDAKICHGLNMYRP